MGSFENPSLVNNVDEVDLVYYGLNQFLPPPCTAHLHNRLSPTLYFNLIYDVLTS